MAARWKKTANRLTSASVPYVTAAAISAIFLLGAVLYFKSYNLHRVDDDGLTATITAATESLSFSLEEDRESAWNLPAGIFFVATDQSPNEEYCKKKTEDLGGMTLFLGYTCQFDSTRRLEIDGAANVAITLTPAGNLRLSVRPHETDVLKLRLMDEENRPQIESSQELSYETQLPGGPHQYQVRIPLIATSAQVGQHLHYVSTIEDSPDAFWQPALLSGNVSIIAQNHPDSEKYDVLTESLDTGDVLGIGMDTRESAESSADGPEDVDHDLVWGMVTIGNQQATLSGTSGIEQFLIHVVLHTTHRELSVRRFGTRVGHTIKASQWTIISKWPNGQKAWVSFMSLIVVLSFVLSLGDVLKTNPLKIKKKGRKNRKRKRKGD